MQQMEEERSVFGAKGRGRHQFKQGGECQEMYRQAGNGARTLVEEAKEEENHSLDMYHRTFGRARVGG